MARGAGFGKIKKRMKMLPVMFVTSGGIKRCTLHEFQCPEEPCPYMTANKKVIMTRQLAKANAAKKPATTRKIVWHRDDKKPEMSEVFMTNDDIRNCTFEPLTGSMNPNNKLAKKFLDA